MIAPLNGMIKPMSEEKTSDWVDLLPEEDRLQMLKETVELYRSSRAANNFDALDEALREWEKRAYYYAAFKNQDKEMSEAEAMQLALEAQQAAREQARG